MYVQNQKKIVKNTHCITLFGIEIQISRMVRNNKQNAWCRFIERSGKKKKKAKTCVHHWNFVLSKSQLTSHLNPCIASFLFQYLFHTIA